MHKPPPPLLPPPPPPPLLTSGSVSALAGGWRAAEATCLCLCSAQSALAAHEKGEQGVVLRKPRLGLQASVVGLQLRAALLQRQRALLPVLLLCRRIAAPLHSLIISPAAAAALLPPAFVGLSHVQPSASSACGWSAGHCALRPAVQHGAAAGGRLAERAVLTMLLMRRGSRGVGAACARPPGCVQLGGQLQVLCAQRLADAARACRLPDTEKFVALFLLSGVALPVASTCTCLGFLHRGIMQSTCEVLVMGVVLGALQFQLPAKPVPAYLPDWPAARGSAR
jgi:hypothetical protein